MIDSWSWSTALQLASSRIYSSSCRNSLILLEKSYTVGQTTVVQREIDVEDTAPSRQQSHCLPEARKEVVKNKIDKMLTQEIVQPSCSPWASSIALVEKKYGDVYAFAWTTGSLTRHLSSMLTPCHTSSAGECRICSVHLNPRPCLGT